VFSRYHAVFQSRWRALVWAAGILLTAYCTVPRPGEQDAGTAMVKAMATPQADEPARPKPADPWALDKR
jgi:hypothetical protein